MRSPSGTGDATLRHGGAVARVSYDELFLFMGPYCAYDYAMVN